MKISTAREVFTTSKEYTDNNYRIYIPCNNGWELKSVVLWKTHEDTVDEFCLEIYEYDRKQHFAKTYVQYIDKDQPVLLIEYDSELFETTV
jgi:hypothetical protein